MKRQNISSGALWENVVGYSRAVRVGDTLEISGTAPVRKGQVKGETAYEQAIVCLEIIEETLKKAGLSLKDVTRTRMYVTDISKWEEFGKAHGAYFDQIMPATSMVEVSALIGPKMLIEIEVTAIYAD